MPRGEACRDVSDRREGRLERPVAPKRSTASDSGGVAHGGVARLEGAARVDVLSGRALLGPEMGSAARPKDMVILVVSGSNPRTWRAGDLSRVQPLHRLGPRPLGPKGRPGARVAHATPRGLLPGRRRAPRAPRRPDELLQELGRVVVLLARAGAGVAGIVVARPEHRGRGAGVPEPEDLDAVRVEGAAARGAPRCLATLHGDVDPWAGGLVGTAATAWMATEHGVGCAFRRQCHRVVVPAGQGQGP